MDRAAEGPGDPRPGRRRDAPRRATTGRISTFAAGAGRRDARRTSRPDQLKPLTGKTARRGREDARQVARGDGDGPGRRGRQPRREPIYFLMNEDNVRREAALPWVSFGSDAERRGARRRVPEVEHPPARLRQFRARARQICPRREGHVPAGRDPAADLAARDQSRSCATAAACARVWPLTWSSSTRRRSPTARPMQKPHAIRDRHARRVRQRRAGAQGWRAHRCDPGRFVKGPGWTGWPSGGACKADNRG